LEPLSPSLCCAANVAMPVSLSLSSADVASGTAGMLIFFFFFFFFFFLFSEQFNHIFFS
jgi:hypothetical protein